MVECAIVLLCGTYVYSVNTITRASRTRKYSLEHMYILGSPNSSLRDLHPVQYTPYATSLLALFLTTSIKTTKWRSDFKREGIAVAVGFAFDFVCFVHLERYPSYVPE